VTILLSTYDFSKIGTQTCISSSRPSIRKTHTKKTSSKGTFTITNVQRNCRTGTSESSIISERRVKQIALNVWNTTPHIY